MATLTFLHVSDLHFGDISPRRGDAVLDSESMAWWEQHPWLDGYLGHSHEALVQLEMLYDELCETEPNLKVVITGDLTTTGGASQFSLARGYFERSLIDPGTQSPLGLELGSEGLALAIPGNHDQWPGKRATSLQPACMFGPNQGECYATYGPLPWIHAPMRIPNPGGRDGQVLMMAIDTDADVGPRSVERLTARGSFVSQCVELGELLKTDWPVKPRLQVRVLLMHHSYAVKDFALGIRRQSRQALDELITEAGIDIILTGHFHQRDYWFPHIIRNRTLYEARCGTTTQRMEFPSDWIHARQQQARGQRVLAPNAALVHRASVSHDRVVWRTETLLRTKSSGPFERSGAEHTATFP